MLINHSVLLWREKWLINIDIYSIQSFYISNICLSHPPQEIPQQMNGSDCGMFTCKYAEYVTKEKPIKFTQVIQPHNFITFVLFCNSGEKLTSFLYWIFPAQKHMPYFRRRMVWELVNRKLLWCQWDEQFSSRTHLKEACSGTHTPAHWTRKQLLCRLHRS